MLTTQAPKKLPKQSDQLTFTFVIDGIERAIAQAKAAASEEMITERPAIEIKLGVLNHDV